jgi:hypothetical protein
MVRVAWAAGAGLQVSTHSTVPAGLLVDICIPPFGKADYVFIYVGDESISLDMRET